MAEANISVDQGLLSCPICLELLKDPVTIPCGHSFCMVCITNCWDHGEDGDCKCPQCRHTFNPRPVLGRNPILADMVEKMKKSGVPETPVSDECYPGPGDVACGICVGRKRKADKSCLVCLDSYCHSHFEQHEELNPGKKHKVVDATDIEVKMCSSHAKLLEVFCRTDQKCICVSCVIDDHKGHDIISAEAAKDEKKVQLQASFQQQIQARETELQALRQVGESLKSSAQKTVEECEKILPELMESVKQTCSEVIEMIRDQEEAECARALDLAGKVEEELADLRRRNAELEQFPYTVDHIQSLQGLLCLAKAEMFPRISVKQGLSFAHLHKCVQEMNQDVIKYCREKLQMVSRHVEGVFLEALTRSEMLNYATTLTLDKCSAFRRHELCEDYTKVKWSDISLCGGHWGRFTKCKQVFCNESLSDRSYWEVKWSGGGGISIAVAYRDMDMDGYVSESGFGNNKDSWALHCYDSKFVYRHDGYGTTVPGPISEDIPVGVYLDYKAGLLAFYSVSTTATLLHKVHTTFTKPLCPGFYVDSWSELKICSLNEKGRRKWY